MRLTNGCVYGASDGEMQKTFLLDGVGAYEQVTRDLRCCNPVMREAVCVCMCLFFVSFLNDAHCAGPQGRYDATEQSHECDSNPARR